MVELALGVAAEACDGGLVGGDDGGDVRCLLFVLWFGLDLAELGGEPVSCGCGGASVVCGVFGELGSSFGVWYAAEGLGGGDGELAVVQEVLKVFVHVEERKAVGQPGGRSVEALGEIGEGEGGVVEHVVEVECFFDG